MPSIRQTIMDYLGIREERLRGLGLDAKNIQALFPNEKGEYMSANGWRWMRIRVYRTAGIEGNYKVLRPSFGQKLKDAGAPIEAVSKALRHSSTVTTERFYARIRSEKAWDTLEALWERPKISIRAD